MDVMEKHLALILNKVPEGRHAVIVVDGAAWHQCHLADKFKSLSIIKLPPYSPELNPIEQVWQWLRQNELANWCFKGYDDIVDKCIRAWSSFISNPSRVMKLCSSITWPGLSVIQEVHNQNIFNFCAQNGFNRYFCEYYSKVGQVLL